MKYLIPKILCLFITLSNLLAQPQVLPDANAVGECGLHEAMEEIFENDPALKIQAESNLLELMLQMDDKMTEKKLLKTTGGPVTVPVVFHFFYAECEDPDEMLTNERFENAIAQLNADFSGQTASTCELSECSGCTDCSSCSDAHCTLSYPDRLGSSNIHFKLADKDPDGHPTTGINRIKSGLTDLGLANGFDLKEEIQWNRSQYLNIYVVHRVNSINSSGLAHYPTTSHENTLPDGLGNELYDGPTVASWAFDPNPTDTWLNRFGWFDPTDPFDNSLYDNTISHEVGHWLGLRHTWGDTNSNQQCSNCNADDFDFINTYQTTYSSLLDPDNIPNWNQINDTPNTIGSSTRDGNCVVKNTCADYISGYWENSVLDPSTLCGLRFTPANNGQELYDMYDNFMDYSACVRMFSKGQVDFMNLSINSGIANRNNLVASDNHNLVFYANPSNENRVVFKDYKCYESVSNNGSVSQELEIESKSMDFKTSLIGQELSESSNYFSISPALPNNLQAKLKIQDAFTATLEITGTTPVHNNDLEFTVTLGAANNPFNESLIYIPIENRSKVIEIDFIEESNIYYDDLESFMSVGTGANLWEFIQLSYLGVNHSTYLIYEPTSTNITIRNTENITFYENSLGKVKIFQENQSVSGILNPITTDFVDLEIDPSTISGDGIFYIGFSLEFCEGENRIGWIRLKYDNSCGTVQALDYAFNSQGVGVVTGIVETPTLAYNDKRIIKNSNGTFTDIEVKLLQSNTAQTFKTGDLSSYITITDILAGINIDETAFTVTSTGPTTALIEANPTHPYWTDVNNDNSNIEFLLEFDSMVFNGLSSFEYASVPEVDVFYVQVEPLQISSSNSVIDPTLYSVGDVVIPLPELHTDDYFQSQATLGLFYYDDGIESGYLLYTGGENFNISAMCVASTSTELDLVDYGTVVNPANLRQVGGGALTSSDGLPPDELFINDATIAQYAGQEKYILYRFLYNCEAYDGYLKILMNADGSVTLLETVVNLDTNTPITAGELPNSCIPNIYTDIYAYNDHFSIDGLFTNNQLTEANAGQSTYTDYTNLGPIVFDLEQSLNYNFRTNTGNDEYAPYWYIWIDYNNNNIFESSELILTVEETLELNNFVSFSNGLWGTYKMRIIVSLNPLVGNSGCQDFQYGEVEDYLVEFVSNCEQINNLSYTNQIAQGQHRVGNSIQMSNNAKLYSGESSTMIAGNYIQFLPNTCIQSYSEFEAKIETCGNNNGGNNNGGLFTEYPFLEPIINGSTCCEVMNVHKYIQTNGGEIFIFVETDLSCSPTQYGTFYALYNGSWINYCLADIDCVNIYGLTYSETLYTCAGGKTNPETELTTAETFSFNVLPNPFNDLFTIEYNVKKEETITIELYTLDGKKVKTIAENELVENGIYRKTVEASELYSGIYIVQFSNSTETQVKKLIKF